MILVITLGRVIKIPLNNNTLLLKGNFDKSRAADVPPGLAAVCSCKFGLELHQPQKVISVDKRTCGGANRSVKIYLGGRD